MILRRLLCLPALSLSIGLLFLPGLIMAAPGAVKKGAVTAELVAREASIQPGRPFTVALKLTHDPHWHTYWINPGTGYPTSLHWKLPPGFTAGPIVWPTPHVVKDAKGIVTGHGYENEILLFVEISTDKTLVAGSTVTLRATADWLMCKEVCMPGDAALELALPVTAETPRDDSAAAMLFDRAAPTLPQPLTGWTATARRTGDTFTVRLTPDAGTTHRPAGLHLFDTAGLIDYAAPQVITEDQGSLVLTLAAAKEGDPAAPRLAGVLSSTNGWPGRPDTPGAAFDLPLGAATTPNDQALTPGSEATTDAGPSTQQPTTNNQQLPASAAPPAPAGLLATLAFALLGGLVLNLMPCVFPVLGIKVLGFVNQSGSDRTKVITHGLVFSLGVLVSFWALAGLLLALRAGGSQLGWGFQLQSPAFVFGMAAFLLIFALNLSGLFEVGLSATAVGGKLQMQQGYGGSFFTGVLATLVATPCSAPFLAPALGAALALPAFSSLLVFTAIAIGLAAPYLLLSIFPAAVKLLPRPGAWMETFKQLMAFPLYATVGWLLWVLAAQTKDNDNALLLIVLGFVLIAMAAWVYGRFVKPAGRVAAAALLVGGLWLGWPVAAEPAPAGASGYVVKWEPWSPAALEAARAAGRTVYVDFTARWCATCQTNKATVFSSGDVLADLAQRNVLLLRADWTSKDPAITAELARWNRSAVPFNLIYAPGRPEPLILPELLTPGIVRDALASVSRPGN
ncbi:Thiol:disulfide interchange protein DsbD precursor [Lacunisphaera limnophila]|uniref:Thiol:disulfide interchange protein DsbD n=1 Tax=Lacunisphaera limnophila TaxID=1838286 RepID=A0A1D8AUB8_9BACT|nr:thioredoxin family protein [Lacunisphaera limnophila]AOS44460.1 Thiol:disulfide interchange protein DsbD precursor [Lacunisphaera limnophila]